MRKLSAFLRLAQAFVCLAGSVVMHECTTPLPAVFASQRSQQQDEADVNVIASEVHNNQRELDTLSGNWNTKIGQVDTHLAYTDTRLDELSNKISVIQGVGTGVLGVLGVLQILGYISTVRATHKEGA